jgi:hypothetical protein
VKSPLAVAGSSQTISSASDGICSTWPSSSIIISTVKYLLLFARVTLLHVKHISASLRFCFVISISHAIILVYCPLGLLLTTIADINMTGPLYWCNCAQRCAGGKGVSQRTYRRHTKYWEAQLSPEFSQFLERNRNENSMIISPSTTSMSRKRGAGESVGYGDNQMVTKTQRVGGNYDSTGRASSQSSDSSNSVCCNDTCSVNASLNIP